jgi:DnaJ-class molecular chaperone
MKTEVRQKTVDYKVFIADDGQEFDTKKECVHHERILKGEIKVCPECNGEGRTSEWEDWENYHTGAPEKTLIHPICKTCHGKGYLEKKIKEVWE